MKISVVIPFYNEEDNIDPIGAELAAVRESLGEMEAILVDDGSTDRTLDRMRALEERHPFVLAVASPGNRGQSAAMLRGLRAATGDILVTLDGDLQNNPGDIPALIEAIAEVDVVCGYRANRRDSWSRRAGSRIGNRVRNWFTGDGIRDTGCSLKAFRRECADDLPPVDGVHRFMPAYFKLNGRSVREVPVDHRERKFGRSKYTNLQRLPRTIYDLMGFCWYRRRYIGRAVREPSGAR
jgi:dolichol-phosphate mannosyltransferase